QGLDSQVATARRMLDGNAFDAQADSYLQAMRLGGSLVQSGNLISLFAASEHPKGGRNRRRATPLTPEIQSAQQQWQLARNVDAMIRQHQDDQTTLAKLGELTQGLDGHVRATLVFELAQAALRTGDLAAAKRYLSLFGGNFAHHPLAEAAVLQYFQISTSEEYDHAVRSQNAAQIQLVAATSPDQDPQEVRLSHNLELAKSIQTVQPSLLFDARFRFPLAALHRRSPLHQSEAEGFYRGELSSQVDFAWRSCAATELALLQPDAAMVKPVARCQASSVKPFLDGQLTDDAWQAAVPLELKVRAGRPDMPASYAFFVHDEEFLYVAFTAMKVPGFQYEQDDTVRQRDTDLRERDRMVLRLDTDRDYATCFCLTV
ncbi:MAG: hypothetical protein KDA87_27225, partial [Planctomycetales bacterium]|nr:hypothetical protein [Planctomycetales bacterium]